MRRPPEPFAAARLARWAALALLFAAAPARADDAFVKVIPPGAEALIGDMLGGNDQLAGGCVLDGASIERTRIVATYACAGRKVTLALHHPNDPAAAAPVARSKQFALVAKDDAPKPLADDVAARIAAREGAFRWVSAEQPGQHGPAPTGDHARAPEGAPPDRSAITVAGPPPPHHFFTTPSTFGAAALLIALASSAGWIAFLRRARVTGA
jgi:hypothetical protein